METVKVTMIVETGEGGFWGRVHYEDNLIAEFGETVGKLTDSMRQLLVDFHHLTAQAIEFEYQYDLTALFDSFGELNISKIAQRAGINPSLMRQYARAIKFPSPEQAKKIEIAIHQLGKELLAVHLTD